MSSFCILIIQMEKYSLDLTYECHRYLKKEVVICVCLCLWGFSNEKMRGNSTIHKHQHDQESIENYIGIHVNRNSLP